MNECATTDEKRFRATRRVTVIGAATNAVLAMVQIIGGMLSQSHALLTDGVHTLSDLLTDVLVWFAAKHAAKGADEDHPYGHRRIETVATVGLSLILVGVGVSVGYDALQRIMDPTRQLSPMPLALLLAGIGIAAKEALFHYGMSVARRLRSNMLRANAWHHRSDVVSSLVVFLGIGGTLLGLLYLDALAALVVAVLIARMGVKLGWQATEELVDKALEPDRVGAIREAITAVDGVKAVHLLRTRRMGEQALVDAHLQVNPRISVSEGHRISEVVAARLIEVFDEVTDVTVHIDPENDETTQPNRDLPLRSGLVDSLRELWGGIPLAAELENVQLHYLGGLIHIELYLPLDHFPTVTDARRAAQALISATKADRRVGEVLVYFR